MTDPVRVAERARQMIHSLALVPGSQKKEVARAYLAAEQRLQELERVVRAAKRLNSEAALRIEYPEDVALVEELNDALAALSTPEAEPRCDFGSCTQPQGHFGRHIFESEAHTP